MSPEVTVPESLQGLATEFGRPVYYRFDTYKWDHQLTPIYMGILPSDIDLLHFD
jgi:hypothetical protein